jgi:H+-transporting ATPase
LLAAGTWIVRGTLFLKSGGIVENFGRFVVILCWLNINQRNTANSVQEVLFLEVALTESWVILITRLAQGPNSGPPVWPSWQLLGAVFGVDVLASFFALFGWISGGAPHGG